MAKGKRKNREDISLYLHISVQIDVYMSMYIYMHIYLGKYESAKVHIEG